MHGVADVHEANRGVYLGRLHNVIHFSPVGLLAADKCGPSLYNARRQHTAIGVTPSFNNGMTCRSVHELSRLLGRPCRPLQVLVLHLQTLREYARASFQDRGIPRPAARRLRDAFVGVSAVTPEPVFILGLGR